MDALGKGGAVRRAGALDARQYVTVPIAAPTEEERAHPYLWRFWRQVPARGGITIFDRSWYGRVLVERVEQLCTPNVWMRALRGDQRFRRRAALVLNGAIVVKFWLISQAEQLRRFKERQKTSFKTFKITPDDWPTARNGTRSKRPSATWSIAPAPRSHRGWVEAEDKRHARIKSLKTIVNRLARALKR